MSFVDTFTADPGKAKPQRLPQAVLDLEPNAKGITAFLEEQGGRSFEQGLYRVHSTEQIEKWTAAGVQAFPEFAGRVVCFGCDWLGRQFALDLSRKQRGQCLVLMLEPGTGQALEVPTTFQKFHDEELIEYRDAALAAEFFATWLDSGGKPPKPNQCVGYKKPLFLGGEDVVENLRLSDLDVYWTLMGQLLAKARG